MKNFQHILKGSILLGLIALASGCIIAEPRDGYYERQHHRLDSGRTRGRHNRHLGRLSLLFNDIRPLFRPRDFGME